MLNSLKKIEILGLEINNVDYKDLLLIVNDAIIKKNQITITGVNVSTINLTYDRPKFLNIISTFDILHPDGIGLYLYSKWAIKNGPIKKRITGSDFYLILLKEIIKMRRKIFIFGDENKTLNKIKKKHPQLSIVGLQNGFSYDSMQLISEINDSNTDILLVGMGAPKQEEWIYENRNKLNARVIIAVGDGIKMFAGTKVRGSKVIRKLGFEWLIRLLNNPQNYWERYLIGIPIFIFRAIRQRTLNKNV